MEAAQLTSRRVIQVLKEKEIELISKNVWGKIKENKKNAIDTLCGCNFNTFVEEHFSSKSRYLVILV